METKEDLYYFLSMLAIFQPVFWLTWKLYTRILLSRLEQFTDNKVQIFFKRLGVSLVVGAFVAFFGIATIEATIVPLLE